MIRINTGKVKSNGVCNIQKNGVELRERGYRNNFEKKISKKNYGFEIFKI
jgi:hypothetical protein